MGNKVSNNYKGKRSLSSITRLARLQKLEPTASSEHIVLGKTPVDREAKDKKQFIQQIGPRKTSYMDNLVSVEVDFEPKKSQKRFKRPLQRNKETNQLTKKI